MESEFLLPDIADPVTLKWRSPYSSQGAAVVG